MLWLLLFLQHQVHKTNASLQLASPHRNLGAFEYQRRASLRNMHIVSYCCEPLRPSKLRRTGLMSFADGAYVDPDTRMCMPMCMLEPLCHRLQRVTGVANRLRK